MKKSPLKNPSYHHLVKAFGEWLDILGYDPKTVYNMPLYIRNFLSFLEMQGISQINLIKQEHLNAYYKYLSSRSNERRGGGLSNSYINSHLNGIERFLQFLHHKGTRKLPTLSLKQLKPNHKKPDILTPEEIIELYSLTQIETNHPTCTERGRSKQQAMNQRDRAMIAVLYGCGLRRTEAASLQVGDINFDRNILHVRKGKMNKERFVPMSKTVSKYLQDYIYEGRAELIKENTENAIFIGYKGNPMQGGGLYQRLKLILLRSDNHRIKEKEITLHTLRHSIATHLLENGMDIEKISRFLGHSSLESTQIYTHLIETND